MIIPRFCRKVILKTFVCRKVIPFHSTATSTCVDWFFFVVMKKQQKRIDEINHESVFLSCFFQKKIQFCITSGSQAKKNPNIIIYSFTIIMTLSTFRTCIFLLFRLSTFWQLQSAFWHVTSTFWHVKSTFWHVKSTFWKRRHFDCRHFDCRHFDVHPTPHPSEATSGHHFRLRCTRPPQSQSGAIFCHLNHHCVVFKSAR